MPARLLIIALDGADGRLLDHETQNGALPNLAALRSSGQAWPLSSRPGETDDSLWASFQYGVATGEHGRATYLLEDDHGHSTLAANWQPHRETFWNELSAAGRRVAVLDVPKCCKPHQLDGIHLADWLVHGRYFPSPQSYPPSLADEVIARFGAAPPSLCSYCYDTPIDDPTVSIVRRNLLRSIESKCQAGSHFLAQETWDLFIIGFKEAHCSAHMFWNFHDPEHRAHDADRVARFGDPLRDILQAQDKAVGDLVRGAGATADIVVFTTSEFAPNGTLMHLLDRIAARLNDAVAAETDGPALTWLRRLMHRPRNVCRVIHHSDGAGALRIPRLPDESDEAHRARIDHVAQLAGELVGTENGLPVIASVTYPAFEQAGRHAASLPHLLLHYRTNMCPSAVASPRLGRIHGHGPNIRPGNHAPGGFALAAGPSAHMAAAQVRTMADFAALSARILATQTTSQTESFT